MPDVMERTTISLPRELIVKLRVMAAERRTSMAAIIREALEEKARTQRPKPKSIGMGDSGYTDTASTLASERQPPRSWR
jgi:metal-responsive CopG/Arc/MetJ family transcriptional regulator